MQLKERIKSIIYAFPIQLFMVHLKKHQLLIFFWILLGMLSCGVIGTKFGVQYLFLDPEYQGQVGFLSFMFLGLGFGALFITWNITTYILNSYRFSFLGSLNKPFSKYCLNNFIVPFIFASVYLIKLTHFQIFFERVELLTFFIRLSGLLFGFAIFCAFAFAYFFKTNTNISKLLGFEQLDPDLKYKKVKPSNLFINKTNDDDDWHVRNYLSGWYTVRPVRETGHYDQKALKMVFAQNHVNALVIELIFFITLIGLSFLDDYVIFRIPAGASMLLLFSIIIMFLGAFAYWLRGWRYFVMILFLLIANYVVQHPFFEYKHLAYGLDYGPTPSKYNDYSLESLCTKKIINEDIESGIEILENWKKESATKINPKPKMILINSSGGGVRSSLWNVLVMQKVDSILKGNLMRNTALITGASGGMLGAAYYRELYLKKLKGEKVN
ncbi:MAG TPA: hypothetical protein EYQ86_09375, partial [Bacteroidetes bacterium]|nr:hypothetical protein [Bacteroidota bacterium]